MAENRSATPQQHNNTDTLSLTSSGLGSSCENDVSQPTSTGDLRPPDDIISVNGSTSLTVDSLEEEEDGGESVNCSGHHLETSGTHSDMLSDGSCYSDSGSDSFYLHVDKGNDGAKMKSGRHKLKVSELAVHSAEKTPTGKKTSTLAKRNTIAEELGQGDGATPIRLKDNMKESVEDEAAANEKAQSTDSLEMQSASELSGTCREGPQNHDSYADTLDIAEEGDDDKDVSHSASAARQGADRSKLGLCLEDSHKLNEDSSSDPATKSSPCRSAASTPFTSPRHALPHTTSTPVTPTHPRSGIPRRRMSDQSLVTVISQAGSGSGRSTPRLGSPSHITSTPQSISPAAVRRNLTLTSEELASEQQRRRFSLTSYRHVAGTSSSASSSHSRSAGGSPRKATATTALSAAAVRRSLTLNSADVNQEERAQRRSTLARSHSSASAKERSPTATAPPHNDPKHSLPASRSLEASPIKSPSSSGVQSPASFPQSPVKVAVRGGGLRRSASQSETIAISSVNPACCTGLPDFSRENVASRLRYEKHHGDHHNIHLEHSYSHLDHSNHLEPSHLESGDGYLTPSQRRDLDIRHLRQHVRQLNRQLAEKDQAEDRLKAKLEEEKEELRAQLQAEVEEARKATETAQQEVTSLRESHERSVKTVASLQKQLEDITKEMSDKLTQAEEIFLEMYNKGRESAIFEREEELELQKKGGRSVDATETELRNKLERTQAELAKWQTIQRHQSYHDTPVPASEAETTLRFLKDSVFHFLTADVKGGDEHLRAIVRILRFSDVQREKIAMAVIHKRNKSGW